MKTAYGPSIGAPDLIDEDDTPPPPEEDRHATWRTLSPDLIERSYHDMLMEPLIPVFTDYSPSLKLMLPVDSIPNPREISTTQQENIGLLDATRVEPTVAFPYFVRGVAAAALVVRSEFYQVIKELLDEVAERITRGEPLPTIDGDFSAHVTRCERVIFSNGEHSSWRPLIAFMRGAFWILSFINRPSRRRGNYSPLEFVVGLMLHYGALGYIPL